MKTTPQVPPEVRSDHERVPQLTPRVQRARARLAGGHYERPGVLDAALAALLRREFGLGAGG